MAYDFSGRGEEIAREAVKAVDVEVPIEFEERPCVVPVVKENDLLSGTVANLQVEENFVWKHGVLESWHLVGKKLGVEPPDPSTSSSATKENQVASIDPGGGASMRAKKLPFPKAMRRGRTPFDWEAFHAEMKEREKSVEDPP